MGIRRPAMILVALCVCMGMISTSMADELSSERGKMKAILKNVASEVQKNYYDPNLKGLDWPALTEQAKLKIDNAKSLGEMMVAIYVLVDKLHDSHTKFLPPGRTVKLFYGLEAKAIGDDIRIYELKKKDPAIKAGLQLGDRLISVNGFKTDRQSFDLMMMDFRALRPRPVWDLVVQTDNESPRNVRLEARRKQEASLLGVDTREGDIWDAITEAENDAEEHKYEWANYDGIGYVWLREFPGGDTGIDFLRGLLDKVQGSKGIVIDLRSNPGGSIKTLSGFIGNFEAAEATVFNKVGRKKTEPVMTKAAKPNFAGKPFYILVDSRTGSSGELFARYFQKSGKAIIVGDHTPGRVVVSNEFGGSTGAENAVLYSIQVGTARAVFPDGEELEGKGVTPDVMCLPTGEQMRTNNDVCRSKAVSLARQKLGMKDPEEKK